MTGNLRKLKKIAALRRPSKYPRRDSNARPSVPETNALSPELRGQTRCSWHITNPSLRGQTACFFISSERPVAISTANIFFEPVVESLA